ncbi:MAG: GNAT family N-acetyltransferase [Prochlorotrichaceae cyanobacterium]
MPPDYYLKQGSGLDRALLLRFLQRTYQELCPQSHLGHLATTAEQYFSGRTPIWWVEWQNPHPDPTVRRGLLEQVAGKGHTVKVGCLWMGSAVDQCHGDRHSHIFLLYVDPEHRRQGLGRALMQTAETWAKKQGDRQITLQVFVNNAAALTLYKNLGYEPQSMTFGKAL